MTRDDPVASLDLSVDDSGDDLSNEGSGGAIRSEKRHPHSFAPYLDNSYHVGFDF